MLLNIMLMIEEIDNEDEKQIVEHLFLNYSTRIKALALQILKNEEDAEDAVGNTFLRIIKYRKKFIGIDNIRMKRLIISYTRCACFDMYDKKHKINFVSIHNTTEDDEGNATDMEITDDIDILRDLVKKESINILKNAINELKSPAKEIVIQKYYDDTPITEIADLLGLNASTVRTILQRSLQKLKKILEEYMNGNN